jgi:TonB family protein
MNFKSAAPRRYPAGSTRSLGMRREGFEVGIALAIAAAAQTLAPSTLANPASPPPTGARSVVTSPEWLTRPAPFQIDQHYPAEAKRGGLGGRVVLSCGVNPDGRLDICRLLSERPAGAGFGEAAFELAGLYWMKPKTRDGEPVGGAVVSVPIVFGQPAQVAPGAGASEDPDPYGRVVVTPTWVARPTPAQAALAYPVSAKRQKLAGSATLRCYVHNNGGLRNCSVVREEPPRMEFGAAAKKLAGFFRMSSTTEAGYPVAGAATYLTVTFPNLTTTDFGRTRRLH